MAEAFIHGNEAIEMLADQRQQLTVFLSIPAHLADSFCFMTVKQRSESAWQTFVQQNFHETAFTSSDFASSKPRIAWAFFTVGKSSTNSSIE